MKISSKQVGIVVLFWNDSKKTIKCLQSLLNQEKLKNIILLVDNNSDQIHSKNIFKWLNRKKIYCNKVKKNYLIKKKKIIKKPYII